MFSRGLWGRCRRYWRFRRNDGFGRRHPGSRRRRRAPQRPPRTRAPRPPPAPEDTEASSSESSSGTTSSQTGTTGNAPTYCELIDCDDDDPCTADSCDDLLETCLHDPAAGAICDDGDECTWNDTCQPDGTCQGEGACPIEHCGTISADETWSPPAVHILTCPVYVEGPTNPVLTIEDGTTVLADPWAGVLIVGRDDLGSLQVQGETEGVLFSSNAAAPAPGDWEGIVVLGDAASVNIVGATVEYAGLGGLSGGLTVYDYSAAYPTVRIAESIFRDNADAGILAEGNVLVEIRDSTISDNEGDGIAIVGAQLTGDEPSFTGNTVTDNGGASLRINADAVKHLDPSSTYAGNAEPILIRGGVETSGTWRVLDEEYHSSGDVDVHPFFGDPPPILVLERGVTLMMNGNALWVGNGFSSDGVLVAEGTAEDPIRFIGGTVFLSGDDSEVVFENVIVEKGGGIIAENGSAWIMDSIVRQNTQGLRAGPNANVEITGTGSRTTRHGRYSWILRSLRHSPTTSSRETERRCGSARTCRTCSTRRP